MGAGGPRSAYLSSVVDTWWLPILMMVQDAPVNVVAVFGTLHSAGVCLKVELLGHMIVFRFSRNLTLLCTFHFPNSTWHLIRCSFFCLLQLKHPMMFRDCGLESCVHCHQCDVTGGLDCPRPRAPQGAPAHKGCCGAGRRSRRSGHTCGWCLLEG